MRGKRPTFGSKPTVTGEFGTQDAPEATLVPAEAGRAVEAAGAGSRDRLPLTGE